MRRIIDRIRGKVLSGEYSLTYHAIDEMIADSFEEEDFEEAMASGRVVRRQKDPLGRRKYTVEGRARDNRHLRAVCRFAQTSEKLIVITIYESS